MTRLLALVLMLAVLTGAQSTPHKKNTEKLQLFGVEISYMTCAKTTRRTS